ncbi:MAG: septum formation initiator family protein [Acidimicrobiales bacterium]|nr:septum formation initiator family protein [Acidimicrobiales bacterium]
MTAPALVRRLAPPGLTRWLRPLLVAGFAIATMVVLALYVFPTRTWIDQRAAIAETESSLDAIAAEREALEARVTELDTDSEIELIARTQYGLVLPGEEAYAVLPAPEHPVELPSVWPFGPITGLEPVDDATETP